MLSTISNILEDEFCCVYCDTCKYEYTKPTEEPCFSCLEDDVDMWEKDE